MSPSLHEMSAHHSVCTIVNRNYPPDPGVTGHAAAELASFLTAHGIGVTAVSVAGRYAGGVTGGDGGSDVARVRVPAIYDGKRALPRLAASLIEGRSLSRGLRDGVVIGMTDPPLLNWWLARHCAKRGLPWICWSMDLYPDAFASAGLVSRGHPLFRRIRDTLRRCRPDHLIALGAAQADFLREALGWDMPYTILPCGIHDEPRGTEPPIWHPGPGKTVLGYLGNIGQAHDPRFVRAVMRALDPDHHLLLLSPYGIHARGLLEEAARHPAVRVVGNLQRGDLGWIDVHLVSLLPQWDHVCVPSKAVSAVCSGSAILACMSDRNDNWRMLGRAGWRIDPGADLDAALRQWAASLTSDAVAARKREAVVLKRELWALRDQSFADIRDVVLNLSSR